MHDLNSVLLEGTIDKVLVDEKHQRNFVDLKTYGRPRKPMGNAVCSQLRVETSKCFSAQAELSPGRKIRVVGRLERVGRAMSIIIAEHIELKPQPVPAD